MNHKNSEYDVFLPVWDQAEPWFEFAEGQRGTFVGNYPWRISPLDKKHSVHEQASTCGAVVSVYKNAIAVGGPVGTREMLFMGILMTMVSTLFCFIGVIMLMVFPSGWVSGPPLVLLVLGLYCFSFFIRLSFFNVRDMPVLFNRDSRLICISKPKHLSFLKFWEPGGIQEVMTYSWGSIHARTYKYMQMMGETSRESYNLTLLCADQANPRSFKDFTYLGYVETWEDAPLWRLWEHIRRYMEEDGPPLQPGEMLRTSGFGKLPKFPQHLMDAAGGEALSIDEIEKLTDYIQGAR